MKTLEGQALVTTPRYRYNVAQSRRHVSFPKLVHAPSDNSPISFEGKAVMITPTNRYNVAESGRHIGLPWAFHPQATTRVTLVCFSFSWHGENKPDSIPGNDGVAHPQ